MFKAEDIRIKIHLFLPHTDSKTEFLYGTTDENVWEGNGTEFDVYQSILRKS